LEKNVVDLQLREMSSFLESKFEETFTEEMKVVRAPGVQDTHIHCAFLLLDPLRLDRNIAASSKAAASNGNGNGKYTSAPRIIGGLDEDLDLQVLRTLQGKTTVVPVISKADTITTAHMTYLKKTVWDSLRKANLDPLEALGLDDLEGDSPRNSSRIDEQDEDSDDSGKASGEELLIQSNEPASSPNSKGLSSGSVRRHKRIDDESESSEIPSLPLSIISPDIYEPGVIGRKFPWGFADPLNVEHCDFLRLKEAVFSEWRGELREASRELWYEGWRTSRLKHREPKPRR
jgi:septin family protein